MQRNSAPKLPPFGKVLADRQRFTNLPFLAVVCVGHNAWNNAKHWNGLPNDCVAMVLPPELKPSELKWPVNGCLCLIEWNTGPSEALIIELVKCLLRSGAEWVTVRPLFVDLSKPAVEYDETRPVGDRWVPAQETIRIYHSPRKEVAYAA